MKHIIELTDIIEHIVLAEQIGYLLAGKGFIPAKQLEKLFPLLT